MARQRPQRRPRALAAALLAVLAAGALAAGCGGRPAAPPAAVDNVGYHQLREVVGDRDFTPLLGRSIVIDPGHGGHFPGVVGRDGLREADVNLGVALYLRGLLEWAGANVVLTRSADYDFLTPADSSLAADLAARVAVVDSLRPDVFVSIHHNSNAALDRDLNETQTYYPVGRDGPDLDLARAIHRHLVKNLEIEPAKIMAGNFYVLRNSPVTAALGEPAMLSHPEVERKLSRAKKQELEAKAYFLGLLDFFAGGNPRFEGPFAMTPRGPRPLEEIVPDGSFQLWDGFWSFSPGGADSLSGPALDPASVRLLVDGAAMPVNVSPDGRIISTKMTKPRGRGRHRIELTGRNLAGRAAVPWIQEWTDDVPTGDARILAFFENPAVGDRARALLTWSHGLPEDWRREAAMTDAEFAAHPKRLGISLVGNGARRDLTNWPGSRGWDLLPVGELPDYPQLSFRFDSDIRGRMQGDTFNRILPAGQRFRMTRSWPGGPIVPGGTWSWRLDRPDSLIRDELFSFTDPHGPVLVVREGEPLWVEAPGAKPLLLDAAGVAPFDSLPVAYADTLRWRPLLPGVYGKVVIVDPKGGAADDDGRGPLGTPGSELNLRVAEYLADLLRGVGARPVLIRRNEGWMPPEERVLLANREKADLYLEIRRCVGDSLAWDLRHHVGSRGGANWASLLAGIAMAWEPDTTRVAVTPGYAYLLRHTACPALSVGLEAPHSVAAEDRLSRPACLQAQARALFVAVVSQLAGRAVPFPMTDPALLIAAREDLFPPLETVDWARWDGNLLWLPPCRDGGVGGLWETGVPGMPGDGPGHTLEVRARDGSWRLVALRLNDDGDVTMQPVLGADGPRP